MAESAGRRLFVGNLDTGTSEKDLQNLFKGFEVSNLVLKRKNTVDGEAVFAYVNINPKLVNQCLKKLNGYKWKGRAISVQAAKESFLDRLKKEISERSEKNTSKETTPSSFVLNNHTPKNEKIVFNLNDEASDGEKRPEYNAKRSSGPSEENESNIPRRRNLPMFQGINAKNDEEQFEIKRESSFQRTLPAKQNVQKKPVPAKQHVQSVQKSDTDFCMKRFEEFSSVWRDDETADSFQFGGGDRKRDFSGYKKESSVRQNSKPRTRYEETERTAEERKPEMNSRYEKTERKAEERKPEMNSRCVSEMKRKTALEEKWNVIKEKKSLIRNALKNVTPKNSEAQESSSKMTLFEDDPSDEDTFEPNFEVKSYLDGEKGLKRLNLKAKLAGDERFRLDERFFDADDNRTDDTNNLKKRQSNFGSMKRYDPAQSVVPPSQSSEHATAEPKAKKPKLKSNTLRTEPRKPPQTAKPEVSKEKHYSVSDNLKEAFRNGGTDTSFSLSALFDAHLEQNERDNCEDEEEEPNSIIHPKTLKYTEHSLENSFVSDDEDADEENDTPLKVAVPSGKVLGKCGVWGETFFFRPDDSRLKEVPKFYQSSKPEENKDFGKRRKQLRSIVKKRIQNSRRDKRVFKRKLGGRLDRSKFKMRLKKINLNQ